MSKTDGATGVVTIALAGINASFTAADIEQWGTVLMNMGPLMLILFLIWRIYKLDQQHKDCLDNHAKMQEQVLLAYLAIKNPNTRQNLPSQEEFLSCSFNIADIVERRNSHE
ncbi:hypothetical protein D3C81_1095520 [compost metagenome]